MCSDPKVAKEVQERLDAGEPFTSACISHPIISTDHKVRHFDVSSAIREMWRHGEMLGKDGPYCRTSITVWPGGPGSTPQNAWLYHPDQFDPQSFKPTSRVLVRNVQDDDDGDDPVVSVTNTADGSTVQKQCQVQAVDTTLNVPRSLIEQIGWKAGDNLVVEVTGSTVVVKKTADSSAKRKVDQEGRIRLHGAAVAALQTTSPVALLVTPNGADDYIQVSALTAPATTTTAAPSQADDADSDTTPADKKGVSVWE